jgi:hypothetical protein
MELSIDAEIVKHARIADLLDEADQILSIVIFLDQNRQRNSSQPAVSNQQSEIVCVIGLPST